MSRLPDFFLIGGMKCGSTTLFEYLNRHPRVFMCTPKEPMFFSGRQPPERGIDWYRSLFAGASPDQIAGEASTCYSRWPAYPGVPKRIHRLLPGAKFLYILRHPVERAYSHYGHLLDHEYRGRRLTFEEALRREPEILHAGHYLRQIECYLEFYSRESILVLTLDDLKEDPEGVLGRVFRFLGLGPLELVRSGPLRANRGGLRPVVRNLRKTIRRIRTTPGFAEIIDLLPARLRKSGSEAILEAAPGSVFFRGAHREALSRRSPLTRETRERLLAHYRPANQALEEFLGRRLPNWYR